jgi:hypothetical protein
MRVKFPGEHSIEISKMNPGVHTFGDHGARSDHVRFQFMRIGTKREVTLLLDFI